jgi:hypothetical protein
MAILSAAQIPIQMEFLVWTRRDFDSSCFQVIAADRSSLSRLLDEFSFRSDFQPGQVHRRKFRTPGPLAPQNRQLMAQRDDLKF